MIEVTLKWLFENAERVGIVTVLILLSVGTLVAWIKEWLISGVTHLRVIGEKDKLIELTRSDCQYQRDMNDRLLGQLERTVTAAEPLAVAAAHAVRRKP